MFLRFYAAAASAAACANELNTVIAWSAGMARCLGAVWTYVGRKSPGLNALWPLDLAVFATVDAIVPKRSLMRYSRKRHW